MPEKVLISVARIERTIRTFRGHNVMIDEDLAALYLVSVKALNQAVKRNHERFPADFMFQLTRAEFDSLKSQIAMSNSNDSSQIAMSSAKHRGTAYRPYAFTEHGALQAANVLRSERAVQMSVFVIRAFVKMREALRGTPELARKLTQLEKKLTDRLNIHEAAIVEVLQEVMQILNPPPEPEPPQRRIGFHSS